MSVTEDFDWFAPVLSIKGIGEALALKLTKLNIHCVGDLLLHFPFRYENHTQVTPMRCLCDAQNALIEGTIISANQIGRQKKRYIVGLRDPSGYCEIVFFKTFHSQETQWQKGSALRCFGQAKLSPKGFQMVHPEWTRLQEGIILPLPETLTPIYPTVAGLAQKTLRKIIHRVLMSYENSVNRQEDVLASKLGFLPAMMSVWEALKLIHQPTPDIDQHALVERQHSAYRRLIIEELLAHHITMLKIRENIQTEQAKALVLDAAKLDKFLAQLPFQLTAAQEDAWNTIRQDLAKNTPMLRLVQGDVGCGKTIVAALAALTAVSLDQQVVIMVPTEILAEQHLQHFQAWFEPFSVRCELLTGRLKAKERRSVEENIALGLTKIIIGTHALFQENVKYQSLGLVIIDEQHRFGVHQRLALREKGYDSEISVLPHQLIMTATPIPRTLAMSQYAHLDISTISALPPGRQPIKTLAISQSRRDEVIERIDGVCHKGQQIYWVCTLISESETLQCQTAEATFEALQEALPHWRVGLVHGKLSSDDRDLIMQAFYAGEIQILVATTVIEVGVNVPNATLMVIENAERLGLAQLHQLRGRVGRGHAASFCVLLYQSPLSEMAQARLGTLRDSNDGFVIAEADLSLRGPGEILGTKQTGVVQFRVSDLKRDEAIIQAIPEWMPHLKDLPGSYIESIVMRWLRRPDYVNA